MCAVSVISAVNCEHLFLRFVDVPLTPSPNPFLVAAGKSSTINALFGSKKTAVAPTPGKTKHFQTLFVSPTVCLCDCPGTMSQCDC